MAVCPNCGTENVQGKKFCRKCGLALARACPSCGAPVQPDDSFCGECGTVLGPAPEAAPAAASIGSPQTSPAAERRIVSVLFADLVGFTALSESRDPEEVRDLLTRYFDTARNLVSRYGGAVEKFIGDAVMAVWGAPVAHEDDAERAVRAALDLVDAVALLGREVGTPDLRLRAGVLTGEAAVTVGAQGQGMVAGDLVNTASRIQSIAEPGTVLVGESTYRGTKDAVSYQAAGIHEVKGKEEPIAVWRAERVVAARRGARWTDVLEPPFVGRDDEFRLVKDLFHATVREGRARLVSVTGIAGIGKSRLAWELYKYLDGLAATMYWHQGRSPAYGDGLTFWALAEMVRMRARIAETDDLAGSRRKLGEMLADFVPEESERRWIEPLLAQLLGADAATTTDRDELFGAWRLLLERIADRGPVVLVFEDLQWADTGMIDFVEHVLEWSRAKPILIVTLARPELLDRRPTWGAGQRSFTSLHLDPLSEEAMRGLLLGMAHGLPETLVARVLERAEGVPLYAVETVRMLLDQGRLRLEGDAYVPAGDLGALGVPETLQSLIASRLDGLDADDRRLLQDASVLGKTFTVESLAAIAGEEPGQVQERLKALIRREFLTLDVDPRSPERGQYGFVQSLIREVAYGMLSKRDRRTKHLAAAHHFEGREDEELASVVATHYLEAYRATPPGPEADALAARAEDSLVAAAERAGSLGSHAQAVGYLERAMEIASEERKATLWERAGEAASKAADFERAERYLRQALAHRQADGDQRAVALATVALSRTLTLKGLVPQAVEMMEAAAPSTLELGADPAAVEFAAELARIYMMSLEGARSLEWADRALAEAERQGLVSTIAEVLATKGGALNDVGRRRESVALLYGAVRLAREHGLFRQELRSLNNLLAPLLSIRPAEGLDVAREGVEVARRIGLRESELMLVAISTLFALSTGEWDWILATVRESWSAEIAGAPRDLLGLMMCWLAAYRGEDEEADRYLTLVRESTAAATNPQNESFPEAAESQVLLARGSYEESFEKHWVVATKDPQTPAYDHLRAFWPAALLRDAGRVERVLASLRGFGVSGDYDLVVVREMSASLDLLQGRLDEGVSGYAGVFQGFRDLECVFELAMSELEFVSLAGRDGPGSAGAAEEARSIFERLGARPFLERLEDAVTMHQPA